MKKIIIFFFVMSVLACGMNYAQTPAKSPLDPVITKFNNAANKVNTGDFNSAITDFQEVIVMSEAVGESANDLKTKAQAQIPLLNYQIATGMIKQKKYNEAVPYLEKTIQLADAYNNNAPTKEKAVKFLSSLNLSLGKQNYKDKKLDEALNYFQTTLKYSPDESEAFLGMGLIYADKMDEQNMISNLNKAIELSKAKADQKTIDLAQQRMGRYYINLGNSDLADVNTEDPDYSFAIADFGKAISFDPKATDAYYMLSVIHNKTQEFDKAIANALKALETETVEVNIAAINYELGVAYFNTADYPKACESLKKAMIGPIAEKAQARKEKVPNCQ